MSVRNFKLYPRLARPLNDGRHAGRWPAASLGFLCCVCLMLGLPGPARAQQTTPHAWNVAYSSIGTWSDDVLNPNGGQALPKQGPWWDTQGEAYGGNEAGAANAVDAATSGTVTATLTWAPATGESLMQDPPPP